MADPITAQAQGVLEAYRRNPHRPEARVLAELLVLVIMKLDEIHVTLAEERD